MSTLLEGRFTVCKKNDGKFAILLTEDAPEPVVAIDNLRRVDVVKIMSDISKWLEEEEYREKE